VSYVSFRPARSARQAGFEVAQFLPATRNRRVGIRQEHSKLRSGQQVALNLEDQPRKLGVIRHGLTQFVAGGRGALFQIAQRADMGQ
jgi:hypothetical protein